MKKIILFMICVFLLSSLAIATDRTNDIIIWNVVSNTPTRTNDIIIWNPTAVPTTPANDSCTYTSGDWTIQCSDYCNITSNVDLSGNDITFNGTGTVRITANITDYVKATIRGTDSSNLCVVQCSSGGCLKD